MAFIRRLGELQIPFAIVFTKTDKVTQKLLSDNTKAFYTEMLKTWEEMPPCFFTSATTKRGREEILEYIKQINTAKVTS
jgi:GTP-binding protein